MASFSPKKQSLNENPNKISVSGHVGADHNRNPGVWVDTSMEKRVSGDSKSTEPKQDKAKMDAEAVEQQPDKMAQAVGRKPHP